MNLSISQLDLVLDLDYDIETQEHPANQQQLELYKLKFAKRI